MIAGTDSFKRQAVDLLNETGKLRYSFTAFSAQHTELTYYLVNHALAGYKLNFLDTVIMTFLREVVTNAVKANLKRAYFEQRNADIKNPDQYAGLIEAFKREGVANLEDFIPIMKELGLKVHIYMETNTDGLRIIVQNNCGMTNEELLRARERIQAAAAVDSVPELLDRFGDESEGAGLGLLINVILLKRSGIGVKNFQISSDEKSTRVALTIPRSFQMPAKVAELYNRVTSEIEKIPTFPESVQRIINLCDNPKAEISFLAAEIEKDPSVAASILRLANSGGFVVGSRVESIHRAVTVLGIKNVRQLVLAHSSRQILDKHYKVFETFWEHAARVALYCRLIADRCGFKKLADSVFLGGLLHDLGKIVLHSLEPETVKKINGFNLERTENSTAVLEEITLGLSHAEVGARLAAKWNFPPALVDMIRNHHSAFAADPGHAVEVSIVHLADAFLRVEENQASYVYFDIEAQAHLNIANAKELQAVHEWVRDAAAKSQSNG